MTDKTGWYNNQYCTQQTNPVDIPTNFVHDRKKLGDIPTITVHNRQNRVIYQPFLFITYNIGRYTNQYCPRQTKQGDNQPLLSMKDKTGWFTNQYCPSKTHPWNIPPNIVHDRQKRLIYQLFLSTTDKTGWYTSHFCPRQKKTWRNTNHYCQ